LRNIDSEISSDDDDTLPIEESLTDRLLALRDIIPPTTRSYISSTVSTATSYIKSGLGMGGKALFVLSTSALLLGVPWALAFAEEQQVVEMEKEMRMREMGSEVSFIWGGSMRVMKDGYVADAMYTDPDTRYEHGGSAECAVRNSAGKAGTVRFEAL
jgi:hypothetical protein